MGYCANDLVIPTLAGVACASLSVVGVWVYGLVAVIFSLLPRIMLSRLFPLEADETVFYLVALFASALVYFSVIFSAGTRVFRHPVWGVVGILVLHILVSGIVAIYALMDER